MRVSETGVKQNMPRLMKEENAEEVAKIHKTEFSTGDFLPNLGIDVLRIIYTGMLKTERNFGFVAEENNQIIGFITATEDASSLFKGVIKKEFAPFSYYLLIALAKNPSLIPKMIQTLGYGKKTESDTEAELISIAIKKEYQGKGIGQKLVEVFLREMKRRGKNKVKVTVNASNKAANNFYKKIGFSYIKPFKIYDKKMNLYTMQI